MDVRVAECTFWKKEFLTMPPLPHPQGGSTEVTCHLVRASFVCVCQALLEWITHIILALMHGNKCFCMATQ